MLHLARLSHIALIIAAIGGFWWLKPQDTELSADTMLRAGILLSLLIYGPLLKAMVAYSPGYASCCCSTSPASRCNFLIQHQYGHWPSSGLS